MTSWVPMIGVVILLFAGRINFSKLSPQMGCRRPLLAFMVSFLLTAYGLKGMCDRLGFVENSDTEKRVKYLEQTLDVPANLPANILILDGGSYTVHGINTQLLTDCLYRKGYPTLILQNSIGGGCHLERTYIHKRLLAHLTAKEREMLSTRNVILMLECCALYDRNPLGVFRRSGVTERSLTYLDPIGAFRSLQTLYAVSRSRAKALIPEESLLTPAFVGDIIDCGLINGFNVGRIDRLITQKQIPAWGGFSPLSSAAPKFHYSGIQPDLQTLQNPQRVDRSVWVDDFRKKQLLPLYKGLYQHIVYYLPPVLNSYPLAYALNYQAAHRKSISIMPTKDLYALLDGRDYWYDEVHMQKKGAELYTRWFASQLIEKGLLKK